MGGRSSKPVRTIRIEPADADQAARQTEEEQDEIVVAEDTLGIATEEIDYPEPAPPIHDLPTILEEDEEEVKTLSIDDDIKTKSARTAMLHTSDVIPIAIGKPLQKSVSKALNESVHFGIHRNKERFESDMDSSIGDPLMTSSVTSLQNSIMAEQHAQLISNALLRKSDKVSLTKREMLLLERENYEYNKMTSSADLTNPMTPRGQIRRYTNSRNDSLIDKKEAEVNKNKADITANEAAELHKDHKAGSFKSLVKDLTLNFKSDAIKVKVILAWMCKQQIGRIDFGEKRFNPDTPNGYIQLIQEGKGTYPGLFALLCRAANIKCVIINGVSKGAGYGVGEEPTEDLRNTWNAVYIDDGWRLVHPLWVCKSLAGRRRGGWMKIESQGSSRRDVNNSINGIVHFSYNDYFIFTKPEEFIYRHFPDDPKWQLLDEPLSLDSFVSRSYIRPAFFTNEFRLLSVDECVLESTDGEPVEIMIGFTENAGPELVFGYEFSEKFDNISEINNNGEGAKGNGFQQYVFVSKLKDRVIFEVRFSKIGIYKLRLFGGLYSEFGNNPPWIMEVMLICETILPKPAPLPFDPGVVGWGPGPISENVGLYVPSHENSVIRLPFDDVTIVHFILKEKADFDISLKHFRIRPGVLEDFLEYEIIDVNDVLELRISIKSLKDGEYGLKIDILVESQFENACNYIVQTETTQIRENFYQRKARRLLSEAMMTTDISTLTSALGTCEESVLPLGDPDVTAAEKRLQYLQCKEVLKAASLVKRIDKIEVAIEKVEHANLERLFEKEIRRLKHHLKEILALDKDGWTSRIPDIDRVSLMELGQLRQPKQPVKYVIMSMYMLLGVSQEFMTDWTQIKMLLRNKDTTLVEMARLENYLDMDAIEIEIVSVDQHTLEQVQEVLQTYSEDDIRRIDNTAAAYYQWVKIAHTKLQRRMDERRPLQSSFSSMTSIRGNTAKVSKPVPKQVHQVTRHQSFTAKEAEMKSQEVARSKSFRSLQSRGNSGLQYNESGGRVSKQPRKKAEDSPLVGNKENKRETPQSVVDRRFATSGQHPRAISRTVVSQTRGQERTQSQLEKPGSSLSIRPNVQAKQLTMFSERGHSGAGWSRFDIPTAKDGGQSRLDGLKSDPIINEKDRVKSTVLSRRTLKENVTPQDKNSITPNNIGRASSVLSVKDKGSALPTSSQPHKSRIERSFVGQTGQRSASEPKRIQSMTLGKENDSSTRPISKTDPSQTVPTRASRTNLSRQDTLDTRRGKSILSTTSKQATTPTQRKTDTKSSDKIPVTSPSSFTKGLSTTDATRRKSTANPTKTASQVPHSELSKGNSTNANAATKEDSKPGDGIANKANSANTRQNGRLKTALPRRTQSLKTNNALNDQKQSTKKEPTRDSTFVKN